MKTIKISDETFEKIKDQLNGDEIVPINDLKDLVGKTYAFWCARYIYHGKVKVVNPTYIILEDAGIVYETGELEAKEASDLQKLPNECHVLIQSIESFGKMNW